MPSLHETMNSYVTTFGAPEYGTKQFEQMRDADKRIANVALSSDEPTQIALRKAQAELYSDALSTGEPIQDWTAFADEVLRRSGVQSHRASGSTAESAALNMLATDEFELTEDDVAAIDLARAVARRLLRQPLITPRQIVGLGKAIHVLDRLPAVTEGAGSEFGVTYRTGDEKFAEMRYIDFRVSDCEFEISVGGSVYDHTVGSDSFQSPGWFLDVSGNRDQRGDLTSIEDSIDEYLTLGAEITVNDKSDFDMTGAA